MNINPEEHSLQDLTARLAREEQINADLQAQLAKREASHEETQTAAAAPPMPEQLSAPEPTMPVPQPVRVSRLPRQRRFSTTQTILLVVLALAISFFGSSFFVSRLLAPSLGAPYRGDGYTITPLASWRVQSDPFGVTFSDPRFPMTLDRYPSQLGVVNNDPLFLEFGSSSRSRCRNIGGVTATITIVGAVWSQSQYTCASSQKGGVATLVHVLFTTHGNTQKYYAIYYLTATDRLDDFSNGSFTAMTRTFAFR